MSLSTIEAIKCGSIDFNRANMWIISIDSAYKRAYYFWVCCCILQLRIFWRHTKTHQWHKNGVSKKCIVFLRCGIFDWNWDFFHVCGLSAVFVSTISMIASLRSDQQKRRIAQIEEIAKYKVASSSHLRIPQEVRCGCETETERGEGRSAS